MNWTIGKTAIINAFLLYGTASFGQSLSDKVSIPASQLAFCEDIYFKEKALEKDTLFLRQAAVEYNKQIGLYKQRVSILTQESATSATEAALLKKSLEEYQNNEVKNVKKNSFLKKIVWVASFVSFGVGSYLGYKLSN